MWRVLMDDQTTRMKLILPDGTETPEFTADDLKAAAQKVATIPMKETDADRSVRDGVYTVAADELRAFIERFERLEAEKKDIMDGMREVMAEAKGRGYDTKALRKVISLRKRDKDDIAEEEAVLEMYKAALGMI